MCNDAELRNDSKLNMEAAREAGLPEGEEFTLANFSYSNSVIVQRVFHYLNNTNFQGITVSFKITFHCHNHNIVFREIEYNLIRMEIGTLIGQC